MCLALASVAPVQAQTLPERSLTRADIIERAFVSAQTAQASVAGRALAAAAARLAAGAGALGSALRERQDLEASVAGLNARLAVAATGNNAAAETAVQALQAEQEITSERLAALDARIDRDFPDYRALTRPAPLQIAALQALLAPDEALLMTLTDTRVSYVWAVSKTQSGWHQAPLGTGALATTITALRRDLGGGEELRGAAALDDAAPRPLGRSFDRSAAYQLYQDLVGPLDPIIAGAGHLMVVVDGPLTSLPFGVLVTSPPQGADDDPAALRATDWLIKRQAVTTLPAVSGLATLRRAVAPRISDAPSFVGFGDPLLGYRAPGVAGDGMLVASADTGPTVVTRGVYDDIRRVADLSPLPNTARELRALAATVGAGGARLFLGADATEARVKATDLSAARVVAFATHGLLTGGLPGLSEPALVFTPPDAPTALDDALLTASEAAELRLAADLIILSACDTAGGDGAPGAEGLSGLARAFIYAGARAILVSHWPVDDYAASQLTVRMLGAMYGPDRMPRAQALRASMLALMREEGDRFAHPSIWAPFVVVGEGGPDRFEN